MQGSCIYSLDEYSSVHFLRPDAPDAVMRYPRTTGEGSTAFALGWAFHMHEDCVLLEHVLDKSRELSVLVLLGVST